MTITYNSSKNVLNWFVGGYNLVKTEYVIKRSDPMTDKEDYTGDKPTTKNVADAEYAKARAAVEAARKAEAEAEDAVSEDAVSEDAVSEVVENVCCDATDVEIEGADIAMEMAASDVPMLLVHYTHAVAAEMNGYKTDGSAGIDLAVVCHQCDTMRLTKGNITMVSTGMKVAIPDNHCGLLVCRSSAAEKGVTMVPSVAVIDSDYRGEIMMPLTSTRSSGTSVTSGERFVQLVIIPSQRFPMRAVNFKENLPNTTRGENGFGHTGK